MLFVTVVTITTASCRKEHNTSITKIINVNLTANQSYTTQVPVAGDADDVMQIIEENAELLDSTIIYDRDFADSQTSDRAPVLFAL